jgi:hypothetical protein
MLVDVILSLLGYTSSCLANFAIEFFLLAWQAQAGSTCNCIHVNFPNSMYTKGVRIHGMLKQIIFIKMTKFGYFFTVKTNNQRQHAF